MPFRRIIFWIHLCCGLVAGIVIAIMSITGIAIAFEEEILAYIDRDLSRLEAPSSSAAPLPLAELKAIIDRERPDFAADYVRVMRARDRAYEFFSGRDGPIYINPYTGELRETKTHNAHELLHVIEEWHRWLAINPDRSPVGRFVTGVSNMAFLGLCLTGLYLWFPRKWSWRFLRPILFLKRSGSSRARNFNWHTVFGIWSVPFLTVLAATGIVISFSWAHRLVFIAVGEEPPEHRDFRMTRVAPAEVPKPDDPSARATLERILANTRAAFPDHVSIGLSFAPPSDLAAPVNAAVTLPDRMPNRAYVPVEVDPYTGEILRALRLGDRSLGLQARIWIRFLHTGGAFGVPGKVLASVASAAAVLLVCTGFALAWRRFATRTR